MAYSPPPAGATNSTRGLLRLAGDLAGTADTPTVPGLASKLDSSQKGAASGVASLDSSGKIPSSQLQVTFPVTSVATRTGDVTLAKADVGLGNVDNTSDANKPVSTATQTALNAKADETTTVTGATSLTGGGDLSANRTISLVNDSATPGNSYYYGTNSSGSKGYFSLPTGSGSSAGFGYIFLDDQAGSTDDDKLTAAISLQQSTAGMPPIVLGARNHAFNQTRTMYSGLKLIGQSTGPKNLEQSPNFVTSRITLGSSVSSGTSSWWVGTGGNMFDIYMADFAVQGNGGSSVHQFMDVNSGSLYACQFHSLAFNFMRSVMGRKDRKCLITQVVLSGHWTANNLWDTQFNLGGSDCQLWMGGMINIGPSSSALQTGTYADGDYEIIFDGLSKTDIGYIYMSALNGWRGIKIGSTASHGMSFFGGTYEGYNSSSSRAPGTVIRIEGGQGTFYGPHVGQAMMSPDAAEGGYIHMTGGEWNFIGPQFYRGSTADTVPAIYQTGGRLMVTGATKLNSESWSTRPILDTGATGGNAADSGAYTTYCPDLSMNVT